MRVHRQELVCGVCRAPFIDGDGNPVIPAAAGIQTVEVVLELGSPELVGFVSSQLRLKTVGPLGRHEIGAGIAVDESQDTAER